MLYVQSLVFCFGRLACFQVHDFPLSFLFLENYDFQLLITRWRVFLNQEVSFLFERSHWQRKRALSCPALTYPPFQEPSVCLSRQECIPAIPAQKSHGSFQHLYLLILSQEFSHATHQLRSPWLMINKHSAKGSVKGIVLYFCILF